MADSPLFTVFTATYNRGGTLERVFDSLLRQTLVDFEWLIVDDGSTDGTDRVISALIDRAPFKVRYVRQPNRGKYRAWNTGVAVASGRFIANLDSDDAMLPQALERLLCAWKAIPEDERNGFVGVTGLCVDETGSVVGDSFPQAIFDSDSANANFKYRILGDKAGFVRRDVAAEHLFPEHLRTRFVPEGRIWLDIARRYRTRFINEAVLTIHDHGGGRLSALARPQRALGDIEYNRFVLDHYGRRFPRQRLKSAILMARAGAAVGMSLPALLALPSTRSGKLAVASGYPVASLLNRVDMIRGYGRVGLLASISRSLPRLLVPRRVTRGARCLALPDDREVEINVLTFRMRLALGDSYERSLVLFPQTAVTSGMRFARDALAEAGVFIDLSAGAGFCSLYMSHNLPSGHVIAIEPDEARRSRLQKNVELSCADNVTVLASIEDVREHFLRDGPSVGPAAVRANADANSAQTLETLLSALGSRVRTATILLTGERQATSQAERSLQRLGFRRQLASGTDVVLVESASAKCRP